MNALRRRHADRALLAALCVLALLAAIVISGLAPEDDGTTARDPLGKHESGMVHPGPIAFVATSQPLPRTGWKATASDEEAGFPAGNVVDGRDDTIWHSRFTPTAAPQPHSVTIDTAATGMVSGLTYLPRQDGNANGTATRFEIATSPDASGWTTVATGTWQGDATRKTSEFGAAQARYVR
ncbi:MAG: discoidin domain-containing protein, partial [Rhodococcus sp. (in: high G+C Gram-positive bacteria)]